MIIKIGQTVWLRPTEIGNAYRRDKEVKNSIITKIGTKYIHVQGFGEFFKDSGIEKTNFTPNYKLYYSQNQLRDDLENENLQRRIKEAILRHGKLKLELDKLRKIAKILNC